MTEQELENWRKKQRNKWSHEDTDGVLTALMLFIFLPGVIIVCIWDSHKSTKACSTKHHDQPYVEKTAFLQEGELQKGCVTEVRKYTGTCDYVDKVFVLEDCHGNPMAGTINWENCHKGGCTTTSLSEQ